MVLVKNISNKYKQSSILQALFFKMSKVEFLMAYKERMLKFDKRVFAEFEGAYISTYNTYNTTQQVYSLDDPLCNYANVLYGVCLENGVKCKGVTSERRHHGEYICDLLNGESRDTQKIIYVGK